MEQTVKGVVNIVRGMNYSDRRKLLRQLLEAGLLTEDEKDALTFESRRHEPSRSFDRFVKELKTQGRLK